MRPAISRKSHQALAGVSREVVARANHDRADRYLANVTAEVARSHGYPDIGAYVLTRIRAGPAWRWSAVRRGLHKDWLSRHLARVDPAAREEVRRLGTARHDARWLPEIRALGFADVPGYLTERHLNQHRHGAQQRAADVAASRGHGTIAEYIGLRRADGWTWNAISAESGQPATWLRRHEIHRVD